jgi:hypothetical protein
MDSLTPEPSGPGRAKAARMRRAGLDAGIGPDSPLAPLIEALAQLPVDCEALFDGLAGDLIEIRDAAKADRAAQIAAMRTATAAIEKVSARPLITSYQIERDVLPALLANFKAKVVVWTSVALAGTLAVGAGIGVGVSEWRHLGNAVPAPVVAGVTGGTNKCEDHPDGSRLCWIPVWQRLPTQQAGADGREPSRNDH